MNLQFVDLLSAELVPPKVWLQSREVLWGIGLFALGLLGLSALQALNLPELRQIERNARVQLQNMQVVPASSGAQLNAEITALKEQRQRQLNVLATLEDVPQRSFSAYLKGLSRSRVDGLWLVHIELEREQETTRIGLSGQALAPPLVPTLLDALAADDVFTGYQFTDLKVSKRDRQVEFSLNTRKADAS